MAGRGLFREEEAKGYVAVVAALGEVTVEDSAFFV